MPKQTRINCMTDSEFLRALDSESELTITFTGRKTGRRFSIPIWFVSEGGRVFLLPVKGTASAWYRSVLKNPEVELDAGGRKVKAKARPVKGKGVEETLEMFRKKYGAGDVKRYYPEQDAAFELSV
jgi:deazaflavin-dependent oxidoreductase (nitroreductase family)